MNPNWTDEALSPDAQNAFDDDFERELDRRVGEVERGALTVAWAEIKRRRENVCGDPAPSR